MRESQLFQMRIDPTLKAKAQALAEKHDPPLGLSAYVRKLLLKETASMATPRKKDARKA